jgi:hypothetical protein
MHIHGSCHCSNIRFTLNWPDELESIPARACTCSFCVRHGGVWTGSADATLVVAIADSTRVSKYRFGTGTADFHVCATCGVTAVVTSDIGDRLYAVVNVNTFIEVDPALLQHAAVSFDAEDEQTRLARRAERWIPDVRFSDGDNAQNG